MIFIRPWQVPQVLMSMLKTRLRSLAQLIRDDLGVGAWSRSVTARKSTDFYSSWGQIAAFSPTARWFAKLGAA
jgi:hypothetical protein